MIRVIIADDEAATAELIKEILEETGQVEVVGMASDGLECLQQFEEKKPDALFLDIKMSKLGGIEVAQSLIEMDTPPLIAFVTNFDDYAVKAFELKALDYVIKIEDLNSFQKRISKTAERIQMALDSKAPMLEDMRNMIEHLAKQQLHPLQRKLPIRDSDEGTVRLLDPKNVMFIERRNRKSTLITRDNAYPTYYTIDSLEERLADEGFYRANRGTLLNINYVEHLVPNGDGSYDVIFQNEKDWSPTSSITVSRSRSKLLLNMLQM